MYVVSFCFFCCPFNFRKTLFINEHNHYKNECWSYACIVQNAKFVSVSKDWKNKKTAFFFLLFKPNPSLLIKKRHETDTHTHTRNNRNAYKNACFILMMTMRTRVICTHQTVLARIFSSLAMCLWLWLGSDKFGQKKKIDGFIIFILCCVYSVEC